MRRQSPILVLVKWHPVHLLHVTDVETEFYSNLSPGQNHDKSQFYFSLSLPCNSWPGLLLSGFSPFYIISKFLKLRLKVSGDRSEVPGSLRHWRWGEGKLRRRWADTAMLACPLGKAFFMCAPESLWVWWLRYKARPEYEKEITRVRCCTSLPKCSHHSHLPGVDRYCLRVLIFLSNIYNLVFLTYPSKMALHER